MAVEVSRQQQLASWEADSAVGLAHARRCLFGPVDHEENRQVLQYWSAKLDEQYKVRWNFDFKSECPLPGRYVWEGVAKLPLSDSSQPSNEAPSQPVAGSRCLRMGLRTILKQQQQQQQQQQQLTSSEGEDKAGSEKCPKDEKSPSITNYEYVPCRLQKALLDFQAEARRVRSSRKDITESVAVQCDLSSVSEAVSASPPGTNVSGCGQPAAESSNAEAERQKSSGSTENKLKRKQSTMLEFFQQKKPRADRVRGREVDAAKRRLDL